MNKTLLLATLILMSACSYKPVIDTAGRSGTFTTDQAREITNDIQHCEELVDTHVNKTWDTYQQAVNWYFSTASLGRYNSGLVVSQEPLRPVMLSASHEPPRH